MSMEKRKMRWKIVEAARRVKARERNAVMTNREL